MTIDELVGENVRRARLSAGLSAHELAARMTGLGLPMSEASLARLEAGEDRLGVDALIAVGLALGLPPAALLAPLNLGSLLWMDADGKPMASWALFQDDQRSFTRIAAPAPTGAPELGPVPPGADGRTEAPASPTPEAAPLPPALVLEPITAEPVGFALVAGEPLADGPGPCAEGSADDESALSLPLLPPGPPPPAPPPRPRREDRSHDRAWAIEALQSLLTPGRT